MTDLDITDVSLSTSRERLFPSLDDLDTDSELTVTAEHDPGPLLALYQLERGPALEWVTEETSSEATVRVESAGQLAGPVEFDVRPIPPRRRHELLGDAFDALDTGQKFILVNDHDPKPLYYEFRSTRGDVVSWEYQTKGGGEWRVAVGKTGQGTGERDDVVTAFDVRKIPKPDRHPAIHHRYGMLDAGERMEVVAPHEPRPLHHEFRERYGETFEWEIVESDPGRCQVQITKTEKIEGETEETADGHASCGHHSHSEQDHGHSHEHGHGEDDINESADEGEATEELTVTGELDVRDLPPAQRHENIFRTYAELDGGEAFILVNDHDPKPVYHQFDAETGEEFHWDYRKKEAGEFRVLIGKGQGGDADSSSGPGEPNSSADEQPEAPF